MEPNPESYWAFVLGTLAKEMEAEDQGMIERKPSNISEVRWIKFELRMI